MPLDYYIYGFTEILSLSIIGFIFAILPQIIIGICINLINKKYMINIIFEIIIRIILGFIMSIIVLFTIPGGTQKINEIIFYGYNVYLSIIISGLLFVFLKYIINKILFINKL
jgi:hypothetical protein